MTDLGPIADRLEIIEVCTRVHWCYDHQDWDGLDFLFADAVSMPTLAQAGSPGFDLDAYLDGYLFSRQELKRAPSSVQAGLITQHLIAGHPVTIEGDTAVCLAHSVNVHLASRASGSGASGSGASGSGRGLVAHGNDYQFDLLRTVEGWRIRGWVPRIRWGYGDEASYDADARQEAWRQPSLADDGNTLPRSPLIGTYRRSGIIEWSSPPIWGMVVAARWLALQRLVVRACSWHGCLEKIFENILMQT